MNLIFKTYLLQEKRRFTNWIAQHFIYFLAGIVLFLSLGTACVYVMKSFLEPVYDLMNQAHSLLELKFILISLSLSCSGISAIVLLIQLVISHVKENTYNKMLRNYGVSLVKRHALIFINDWLKIVILSLIIQMMIFGSSLFVLTQYLFHLVFILFLQTILSTSILLSGILMIQIITRFLFKRIISITALVAMLYLSYTNQSIITPFNIMGVFGIQINFLHLILLATTVSSFIVFCLHFHQNDKKPLGPWTLFEFLPCSLLFKQFKEVMRLKDFWFNLGLILTVVLLLKHYLPQYLNDDMILSLMNVVPSMLCIYLYAQIKDSRLLFQLNQTKISIIYGSVFIVSMFIYTFGLLILSLLVPDLIYQVKGNLVLIFLSVSVFKFLGLCFPLNYKDSQQEQTMIAGISLLFIPLVLVGQEVQNIIKLSLLSLQVFMVLGVFILNAAELLVLKSKIYGT